MKNVVLEGVKMEELKNGWLKRQITASLKEIKSWPPFMRREFENSLQRMGEKKKTVPQVYEGHPEDYYG